MRFFAENIKVLCSFNLASFNYDIISIEDFTQLNVDNCGKYTMKAWKDQQN